MSVNLKTYANNQGKFQKDCDILADRLIPVSGKASTPHGELLRCVINLYHDYHNNGFCNIGKKMYEINYIQDHMIELEEIHLDTLRGLIYDMNNMANLNSNLTRYFLSCQNGKYEYGGEFHQNFEKLIDAVVVFVKKKTEPKKGRKKKIIPEDNLKERYISAVNALKVISAQGGNLPDAHFLNETGPNDSARREIILCGMREIAIEALNHIKEELPPVVKSIPKK